MSFLVARGQRFVHEPFVNDRLLLGRAAVPLVWLVGWGVLITTLRRNPPWPPRKATQPELLVLAAIYLVQGSVAVSVWINMLWSVGNDKMFDVCGAFSSQAEVMTGFRGKYAYYYYLSTFGHVLGTLWTEHSGRQDFNTPFAIAGPLLTFALLNSPFYGARHVVLLLAMRDSCEFLYRACVCLTFPVQSKRFLVDAARATAKYASAAVAAAFLFMFYTAGCPGSQPFGALAVLGLLLAE